MPDLRVVFEQLERGNAGSNIAGYFNNNNFYYEISKSANIPAAVFLFDYLPRGAYIYTNLPTSHWLYTYTSSDGKSPGLIHVNSKGRNVGFGPNNSVPAKTRGVRLVAGDGAAGPLGKSGGLYDAAKSMQDGAFYKGYEPVNTTEKGMHRALRYYMLAAYAVLGKCAGAKYGEGNYVCALAVDDTGKILSWGVNSGYFHHGEVNMLLNYFGDHSADGSLPAKTMIFSTLTPCKQCSDYLQTVRPPESIVFMGQQDTGPYGQAGEKHGVYLYNLTDPVLNREIIKKSEKVKVGTERVPDRYVRGKYFYKPVHKWQTVTYVNHYSVDTALENIVTPGNIAKQVGQRCRRELVDSFDTISRKFVKDRGAVKDLEDQSVKIAVLNYLDSWMKTVNPEVTIKNVPA